MKKYTVSQVEITTGEEEFLEVITAKSIKEARIQACHRFLSIVTSGQYQLVIRAKKSI